MNGATALRQPIAATTAAAANASQAGVAGPVGPGASLLPSPSSSSGYDADAIGQLYLAISKSNEQDSKAAKENVNLKSQERRRLLDEQAKALAEARAAEQQQTGFFDSMGIGSLAGIATANPMLVIADMSMHMARLTPKTLKDFEDDNKDTIELATKLYCGVGNADTIVNGVVNDPQTMKAALAIAGMILEQTGSDEVRDYAGTGMILTGSTSSRAAAMVVVADKDNKVADEIRETEKDTRDYTKWVAIGAMAVAGAGAVVASGGTATAIVVGVGVALSVAGFVVVETQALDPLLGKNASLAIGGGMMLAGAVVSFGATATASTAQLSSAAMQHLGRALTVGGGVVSAVVQVKQGLDGMEAAAVQKEVDDFNTEAHGYFLKSERMKNIVLDIIEDVRDLSKSKRRVSEIVNGIVETQCETRAIASAGMKA